MFNIKNEVYKAYKRIMPFIRKTPIEYSFFLSKLSNSSVYLKLESQQITGSFKARGALNKILSLSNTEQEKGIVTASSGNHGLGTAFALNMTNIAGEIYLPENASKQKIEMLKDFGASINFIGSDCEHAEEKARRDSEEKGKIYISPYNDPQVIGGQGTVAVELTQQIDDIDNIFVSVGGGGLISGISGYIKSIKSEINIIGCLPEQSPAMYDAVKAGKVIHSNIFPTLSDGTAGGIEEKAITLQPCLELIDDWILVSEEEIMGAMRLIFDNHRLVIEGAAAVAVASFLKYSKLNNIQEKKSVIIICGGNIDINIFKQIVIQ